ncbi:MFS transporter [Novosphingobium sp.]|jgi:predicted MFS family arabinose efflux permease|uniref:MFS transporter n=1 Tax=Novosphingobium sp. TaxID=1874826 RepID=UPI0022CC7E7B|nr:MFS transporter [Novosphingobium sp.]MCZ8018713.1 MFS transporter [Novosphingobium sp.]MCZ8034718.1 MFS transporter [Novosphingobium sp.]MCZ8052853.1 MFS transporter [Novosphingobium sp.]MCZ8060611.1 MFS transporter [Novosphingobium sp.]MCZ8230637.1 MFS transporter [Novosphingobium sp.]
MVDRAGQPGEGQDRAVPVGLLLFLLTLHIINQIDRQLVAAFATDIMHDLELSRSQFALIAGLAFSGVYAFAALYAGVLADRLGRVRVLSAGLGVWSLFTALAGLAQGFWTMLAARPFVAAGEATLVPTASNIILARVSERHKAAALGLFFAGIPLGIGGGFLIAGQLGPLIGWRWTFIAMGALGLVALAVLVRLKDDPPDLSHRPTLAGNLSALAEVFRARPRALWASLAIIFAHFHTATSPFVQLWLTSEKGYAAGPAAQLYGLMFVIFGLAGTFGAGLLGDWAKRRHGLDRAVTMFVLLLILAPLLVLYRLVPGGTPLFLLGMAGSILFMTVIYGPIFAIIEELLPPRLKATSTGLNMLVLNIFAIGGGALAIGLASEWLLANGSARSWTLPLLGADAFALLAVLFIFLAMRSPRDLAD